MEEDKQNANPTILNPSDLPTRGEDNPFKPRSDGGTGLFDDLVPGYGSDISRSDSSSVGSDEEEDEVEEIDAQEIYGMRLTPPHPSIEK